MQLSNFKILTFDCYGTLIDWDTGIASALAPWLEREKVSLPIRDVLAAHGQHEYALEQEFPSMRYSELLGHVLKRIGEEFGAKVTDEDAERYGESVREWPAFADSVEALKYLKQHFQLVILSNVDRESFKYSNAKLGVAFDAIFTAEEIGSYKPDPGNFRYLLAKLEADGIEQHEILHVAESLHHDHVPAQKLGLKTCWIHRQHGKEGFGATRPPDEEAQYDFHYRSLAELAGAHQRELEQSGL